MSGPSGWSVKHDRFGSIYTMIIYNDIYSDAHTVDTSKLTGLSNKSCHVDHSGTFSPTRLSTSTAVKRYPDCSVNQPGCWSADSHVIPESISAPHKDRFAGSEVMIT